jgi:hypothetical protein
MPLDGPDSKRNQNYLANYRELEFFIDQNRIVIAGMAHPRLYMGRGDYASMKKALDIINDSYETIISLTEEHNSEIVKYFTSKRSDNRSLAIIVEDFESPTLAQFEEFYNIIRQEALEGRSIVIHCRGGWGRTGTMLASLALRELLEAEYTAAPESFVNYNMDLSETIGLGNFCRDEGAKVSSAVFASISKIRAAHMDEPIIPGTAVETTSQIHGLLDLEKILVEKYQKAYKRCTF